MDFASFFCFWCLFRRNDLIEIQQLFFHWILKYISFMHLEVWFIFSFVGDFNHKFMTAKKPTNDIGCICSKNAASKWVMRTQKHVTYQHHLMLQAIELLMNAAWCMLHAAFTSQAYFEFLIVCLLTMCEMP